MQPGETGYGEDPVVVIVGRRQAGTSAIEISMSETESYLISKEQIQQAVDGCKVDITPSWLCGKAILGLEFFSFFSNSQISSCTKVGV